MLIAVTEQQVVVGLEGTGIGPDPYHVQQVRVAILVKMEVHQLELMVAVLVIVRPDGKEEIVKLPGHVRQVRVALLVKMEVHHWVILDLVLVYVQTKQLAITVKLVQVDGVGRIVRLH